MITAEQLRGKLRIPEKIKLEKMILKYFEQEIDKVSKYINEGNKPFGLSFTLNAVFDYYASPVPISETMKPHIEKEIKNFVIEVGKLGYYAQWKYVDDKYIFSIFWTQIKAD